MANNALINWIKKNKIEFIGLFIIVSVSIFFRFYKIEELFNFMGDTGRDAREAYKIIIDHRLTLIGPRASVAGFFMGPLYFYLITIPLLIFGMNAIGLAYFTSFLGVTAVVLIYFLSRQLFSVRVSLLVAFLYSVCNTVIIYSRTSWNPSPVPILTILTIYSLIRYLKLKSEKWYLSMWVFAGLGGQLHYTYFYLIAAISVVLLIYQRNPVTWIKGLIKGGIILLLINSSLLIFDVRHNFITSKAFIAFVTGDKVGIEITTYLSNYFTNFKQLFDLTIFTGFFPVLKTVIILGLGLLLLIRKNRNYLPVIILLLLISLIFFSSFRETVQQYYFNFLLPIPFLLIGYFVSAIKNKRLSFLIIVLVGISFFKWNLHANMNLSVPRKTLKQIQTITESIVARVPENKSFNIAYFSAEPWYSAEEYRYLTYYLKKRAQDADNYHNIDKLFVIATGPMEDPLQIRSQETVEFGATKIEDQWEVDSVKVFQLGR